MQIKTTMRYHLTPVRMAIINKSKKSIKPETQIQKNTSTPMFIAALLTITKVWKQPKCPAIDEWIRQLWDVYTMEYYSAITIEGNFILCYSMDGPGEHYGK